MLLYDHYSFQPVSQHLPGVSCNLPLMQSILLEQFTAQSNTIKSFTMLFANIGADRADRADQSICSSALLHYWLKFQGET